MSDDRYLLIQESKNGWEGVLINASINDSNDYHCGNSKEERIALWNKIISDGWTWAGTDHALAQNASIFKKQGRHSVFDHTAIDKVTLPNQKR